MKTKSMYISLCFCSRIRGIIKISGWIRFCFNNFHIHTGVLSLGTDDDSP